MSRMNRGDIKSKRPKLSGLTQNRILSSLTQNRIIAAVLVGIFLLTRRIANVAKAIDSLAVSLGKVFSNTSTASDSVAKHQNIGPTDTGTASDSRSIDAIKSIADSVYVTDDVGGQATIDDDQTVSFFKNVSNVAGASDTFEMTFTPIREFSDISTVSDAKSMLIGKLQIDPATVSDAFNYSASKNSYYTLSASDSGQGFLQDYVDNGVYFAEDYVGSKFTFT